MQERNPFGQPAHDDDDDGGGDDDDDDNDVDNSDVVVD